MEANMDKFYTMKIAGLERNLPICAAGPKLDIAGFIMFSDVELTIACAKELLARSPEFDIILTAESKGIPLAYEMARQSGKNYILARKGVKLYMTDPIKVEVKSITTTNVQTLYIDRHDKERMDGKRVLIVDDVISTGESIRALEELVSHTTATIVGKATVLAEGSAAKRDDIIFLEPLPLFFHD
jgi:adenine phosphoribosyltransferase